MSLKNSPWIYGLGYFAFMLPSTAFSMYFTFYYVDTLGLAVGFFALARVIYVVWDAVAQPLAGYLSDRTRTRWGRRIPWLVGSLPVYTVVFIMVYSVPEGTTGVGLMAWYLCFQLLFEATAAVIYVNYFSLFPEIYRAERKRARASVIQQGFYILALLIGTALTPIIYTALGFSSMAMMFGLSYLVLMGGVLLFLKEDPEASAPKPLGLRKSFQITLTNGPFWMFSISNMFAAAVMGLTSASMAFYAKYALGVEGAELSILMGVTFIAVIPMAVIWYFLIKRFTLLVSLKASLLVLAVTTLPLFFAQNLMQGIVCGLILSFGLAGHFVIPQLILSGIIDVDTYKTGKHREGMYMAVGNFVVRSSALLTAAAFWIAGIMFGYVSGDDPGPHPEQTFRVIISIMPAILALIAFVIVIPLKRSQVQAPVPEAGEGGGPTDPGLAAAIDGDAPLQPAADLE